MSSRTEQVLPTNDAGLSLSYYGDDFTGSTDVMEALTTAGIRTVLFLRPPVLDELRSDFPGAQACGVAGVARSLSPAAVEEQVGPVISALYALRAPLFHYKVCSTFDSSPKVGNIGHAIRLVGDVFHSRVTPMVIGVPILRRYCVFGDIFAGAGEKITRLDRHPTMSEHPVTPMSESHVPALLAEQAGLRTEVLNLVDLRRSKEEVDEIFRRIIAGGPEVVLFDTLEDRDLAEVGRLLLQLVHDGQIGGTPVAVFGSSGVEYALVAQFSAKPGFELEPAYAWPVQQPGRTLAISGSRAPTTLRQVAYALDHGFTGVTLDLGTTSEPNRGSLEVERACSEVIEHLDQGADVIVYVSDSPDRLVLGDPEAIGSQLSRLAAAIIGERHLDRVIVAGGDTSGRVSRALGIYALEMVAPIAPGAPLCRARSSNEALDGIEVALKGGQNGSDNYIVAAKTISGARRG